ncbi:MAG: hypothetical protein KDB35_01030 [Acidimicrobiales bacterium]|nr:hypothetical protein [Acidimicrobiales bacterium]
MAAGAGGGLEDLGAAPLFLIPALFLELALRALRRSEMTLGRSGPATTTSPPDAEDAIIGGRLLDGLRALGRSRYLQWIALFLLCMTAASTFAYFEQANLVKRAWPDDPDARTRYFSRLNLAAQSLTLLFQALVTTALVRRIGLARTLLVLPGICLLGFLALGLAAADTATAARGAGVAIWVLAAFQVLQQATSRGLASPTRQMLFAPLTRTEKYKAKGFIDTVVYRGGDLVSGFAFDGLIALGLGLAGVAFVTMPLCLAWVLIAGMIGRRQPIEATTEVEATGTAG